MPSSLLFFKKTIDKSRLLLYYCISTVVQCRGKEEKPMVWTFNQREAMFLQIADRMRLEILNGVYAPDQQIPSVRQLATEAAVNPNTMQRALAQLEEEGLLYTRGTVGRFVSSDPDAIQGAKEKMRKKLVRRWIREAGGLGLSVEEMLSYIQKEGNEQ